MMNIKKKIIDGKVVCGGVDDTLKEIIPFDLGYESIKYDNGVYVCEKDGEKIVYNDHGQELFTKEDNVNYIRHLSFNFFEVERDGKHAIVRKSYYDPKKDKMTIVVRFGVFDELRKTNHKRNSSFLEEMVDANTYEMIKTDKNGNKKIGYFNHPVYGTIKPQYLSIQELKSKYYIEDHYYRMLIKECNFVEAKKSEYDCKWNSKRGEKDYASKVNIGVITTIKYRGKELKGMSLINRDKKNGYHELISFLPHQYSNIEVKENEIDDSKISVNLYMKNGNSEKQGKIFLKKYNSNVTLRMSGKIECEYDKLEDFWRNYERIGGDYMPNYIKAWQNDKVGLFIEHKKIVDCEYRNIDYIRNGIFKGIKDKGEGVRLILDSYDKDGNTIVIGDKDWEDVEVLDNGINIKVEEKDKYLFKNVEFGNAASFQAIVDLKREDTNVKQLITFSKYANRTYEIDKSLEYADIKEYGYNKWLGINADGTKDIINCYGEIIIKDYGVTIDSSDRNYVIHLYDNETKQKALTNDRYSKVVLDGVDAKYSLEPTYIDGYWKKECDDTIEFVKGYWPYKCRYNKEEIEEFFNQPFSYFEILEKGCEPVISAGIKQPDGSIMDILVKGGYEGTLFEGSFKIKEYNNDISRTIISLNCDDGKERYGVIENNNGNVVIPFDYDLIYRDDKNEFVTCKDEETIIFDKDGFLTEESINNSLNALNGSNDEPKLMKKTLNN